MDDLEPSQHHSVPFILHHETPACYLQGLRARREFFSRSLSLPLMFACDASNSSSHPLSHSLGAPPVRIVPRIVSPSIRVCQRTNTLYVDLINLFFFKGEVMSLRSVEFKAHLSFSVAAAAAASLYVMFTWFPHGTNCEVLIGRLACSQRSSRRRQPIARQLESWRLCYWEWGIVGVGGSASWKESFVAKCFYVHVTGYQAKIMSIIYMYL